jgi:tetratricopeptide (TPR) repeat protein
MSRGYDALQSGNYGAAREAFRAAGSVRPGDPAIAEALAQVGNTESQSGVNQQLARAASLEDSEQWAQALKDYQALLAEDPSLNQARVRLIPAQVRADLDADLAGYIEDPLKLSNQANFRKAQARLADARGIANPGPRLSGQIDTVERLLAAAVSPVQVEFRSDNQTEVTLFRVAELGRFETRSMQLLPGRYIVAGVRQGYRDVRVEFTITGIEALEPIVVRCEEPI